ncbi:shikimate dehydrogenase family protein [Polaribacter tangerinus]|uniref:shikimate dehydrogenase family protein n=1 Tax=Polaribacter tangerinus TaxID=1920034 RepID=UPI000B4AA0A1|nr:shikimate dehydrogenase [Polaribacter tangerinus]
MEEIKNKTFGLLGKNISYSFSRGYFTEKFLKLNLTNHNYVNFDLQTIEDFPSILKSTPFLGGINVTIPYKEAVLPYLEMLDDTAKDIGAVNTIKIVKNGQLKGYNSDVVGFTKSIIPLIKEHHKFALILGTGGASKAVAYGLHKLGISYKFVSRKPSKANEISYSSLSEQVLKKYQLIVNCTPLGTSPEIEKYPDIPYQYLTNLHLLYDLIYNPVLSTFLSKGKAQGAIVKNGYEMLELQAEESWRIWNL